MNNTPASMPDKLKNFTNPKPINGPIRTRVSDMVKLSLKEKIFNLDNATPNDIKTKKIVE